LVVFWFDEPEEGVCCGPKQTGAMEIDFEPEEFFNVPQAERVRRCRLMAEQALKLSSTASPEAREDYANLAKEWIKLAHEIEQASRRE